MLPEKEIELYRVVAEFIKATRIKLGISQDELALKLGFSSRISITNIENGKQRIQLHTLAEIAEIFNEPISKFFPSMQALDKTISSQLSKNIKKEIFDETTIERIKDFIHFSSSQQKL